MTISETKNTSEESVLANPIEEKKEVLQFQKNHPVEKDKKTKVANTNLKSNVRYYNYERTGTLDPTRHPYLNR
jgi:hypothetical protein